MFPFAGVVQLFCLDFFPMSLGQMGLYDVFSSPLLLAKANPQVSKINSLGHTPHSAIITNYNTESFSTINVG